MIQTNLTWTSSRTRSCNTYQYRHLCILNKNCRSIDSVCMYQQQLCIFCCPYLPAWICVIFEKLTRAAVHQKSMIFQTLDTVVLQIRWPLFNEPTETNHGSRNRSILQSVFRTLIFWPNWSMCLGPTTAQLLEEICVSNLSRAGCLAGEFIEGKKTLQLVSPFCWCLRKNTSKMKKQISVYM